MGVIALRRSVLALIVLLVFFEKALAGSAPPAAGALVESTAAVPADPTLVLDESGYFRMFYHFGRMRISPEALAKDGPALFSYGGPTPKYEPVFKRYVKAKDVDWSKSDWMQDVRVHFFRGQLGDDSKALELLSEVLPPADWIKPDFDDSMWLRRRLGQRKPSRAYQENYRDCSDAFVRSMYVRTYLDVPDPAAAGPLTLNCTYRGGIRVLVNDAEVARQNLPAGELGPDSCGQYYPREAYIGQADEMAPGKGPTAVADLRCAFEDAPASQRDGKGFRESISRQSVNKRGWDRLLALRNRQLGPVTIPANLLRTGQNVLAIEIRGADMHPVILPGAGDPKAENWGNVFNPVWLHAELVKLDLRCPTKAVPSAVVRPAGPQVWVDDMHNRLFTTDFGPAGWPVGKVQWVGAPNGTFSAQVVLASGSGQLSGLKVTPGDLKSDSAVIPASATQVSYELSHPMNQLWTLGYCRSLNGLGEWGVDCPMAWSAIYRNLADKAARAKGMANLGFFDQLSPVVPDKIAANACQPIWLSLKVPADAAGGKYAGSMRIEAQGLAPVTVPLELEVVAFRVPGPREFQMIVQSEQAPYGIVKHYSSKFADRSSKTTASGTSEPRTPNSELRTSFLWSEEHFKLIDSSFGQLARLGADWVFVPVLLNSEFGNRDDSPVRWIKKADGTLSFDLAIVDRYLDLAVKHLGVPRVVCFNIMHGAIEGSSSDVKVRDEASGKEEIVNLGPKAMPDIRRAYWKAFGTALYAHLQAKGLAKSLFWGQAFDNVPDPGLIELMREFVPSVRWAAGGHGRKPDANFQAVARAYGSDVLEYSQKGWASSVVHLLMPRTAGSVICVEGTSTPFNYRVLCDRAIYAGFNGIGRMGADYFDLAFYDGCKAAEYQLVGRSCTMTLWPGQDMIDSSTRNEAMLEGIQEAEARIFLEQTLERKVLPSDLAQRVQAVLDAHVRATFYLPTSGPSTDFGDFTGDWQGRSLRLYQAAAQVAALVGLDVDRAEIGARKVRNIMFGRESFSTEGELVLPALGKVPMTVKVRNWTEKPRLWKAQASESWIVPAKAQGQAAGHEALAFALDGSGLLSKKAGATVSGTLTITDVLTGSACPIAISATVGKAMDLVVGSPAFNVTPGQSAWQEYLLVNNSAAEQAWALEGSVPWMACQPPSGKLAPGASTLVKIQAQPKDTAAASYEPEVTLKAGGGAVSESYKLNVYVIPPYQAPAPGVPEGGEAVALADAIKGRLRAHRTRDQNLKANRAEDRGPSIGPAWGKLALTLGGTAYAQALWVVPHHESVINLENSGFTAFAADVGINDGIKKHQYHVPGLKVSFEIYVDGKLRAQSGLVSDADAPRRLVVEDLANAKEMRLVTRMERLGRSPQNDSYPGYIGYLCTWADPRFFKAK